MENVILKIPPFQSSELSDWPEWAERHLLRRWYIKVLKYNNSGLSNWPQWENINLKIPLFQSSELSDWPEWAAEDEICRECPSSSPDCKFV